MIDIAVQCNVHVALPKRLSSQKQKTAAKILLFYIYIVNPGFTPSSLSGLKFCSTSRRWFSHSTTKGTIAKKSKIPKKKKRKSKSTRKSLNKNVQKQPLKNIQVNSAFPLDIRCQKSTQQFRAKPQTQRRSIQMQVAIF